MTSGDLLVLVPWVIFGVALAVICYLLLTRRYGPGRGRRARRRRPPQPPPEGQLGDTHRAPPRDQDEGPGHARPSRWRSDAGKCRRPARHGAVSGSAGAPFCLRAASTCLLSDVPAGRDGLMTVLTAARTARPGQDQAVRR